MRLVACLLLALTACRPSFDREAAATAKCREAIASFPDLITDDDRVLAESWLPTCRRIVYRAIEQCSDATCADVHFEDVRRDVRWSWLDTRRPPK